jgi:dTMP kinase
VNRRGWLFAAEGLDRSGTTALLEGIARWLERKGLRVETIAPSPSPAVTRAASSRRVWPLLDARIAALISAAELQRDALKDVRSALDRGSVVLVDRYAWTAAARHAARGLDAGWTRSLYAFTLRPDLSIYVRQRAADALRTTARGASVDATLFAVAGSYGSFLQRMVAQLDDLATNAHEPAARPWPVRAITINTDGAAALSMVRDAIRPMLAGAREDCSRVSRACIAPSRHGLAAPEEGGPGERGRLIVLEGIDGAGRSTQVRLMEDHLRSLGRSVVRTSFGSSAIAGELLRRAKRERGWDPTAILLLYAADLAERLEHAVLPALRAGVTVIADRYSYTPVARAIARGLDRDWVESVFAFAPPPDAVVLLEIEPRAALARGRAADAADTRDHGRPGLAATESTMGTSVEALDAERGADYRRYQAHVADWFGAAASDFGFLRVDAYRSPSRVQDGLRRALSGTITRAVAR